MRGEVLRLRRGLGNLLQKRWLRIAAVFALLCLSILLTWLASELSLVKSFLWQQSLASSPFAGGISSISMFGFAIVCLGGALLYFYIDYQQHKRPLFMEMPTVIYTPFHHMRVVTLPKLHYRKRGLGYAIGLGTFTLVLVSYSMALFVTRSLAAPGSLVVTINQKSGTADPQPFIHVHIYCRVLRAGRQEHLHA